MSIPNFNGNNNDTAAQIFYKRLSYDLYSIKSGIQGYEARIETTPLLELDGVKDFKLFDRYLLGKKTTENFAIVPKTENMKQARFSNEGPVYALRFVVDAFDEMCQSYETLLRSKKINDNETARNPSNDLELIKPYKGFKNPFKSFLDQNTLFYRKAVDEMTQKEKSKILNISDFAEFYQEYYVHRTTDFPYFLSDYVRSTKYSPLSTGLMVEISKGDYSNDQYKMKNFYLSDNFKTYTKLALKHGFLIDKNIPWRLVADISSDTMRQYASKYNNDSTSIDYILYDNFNVIDFNDFILMLDNFFEAYNYFNVVNSYNKIFVDTSGCKYERARFILRAPVEAVALSGISEKRWADIYLHFKNKSSQIKLSDPDLIRIKKSANSLIGKKDFTEIITYINNKFNFDDHLAGSKRNVEVSTFLKSRGLTTDPSGLILTQYAGDLSKTY